MRILFWYSLWVTEENYNNFSQKNGNVAKVDIGYVRLKYKFTALVLGYRDDKYNHYTFCWVCQAS
jgi:hypothetical protein